MAIVQRAVRGLVRFWARDFHLMFTRDPAYGI